jgi:NADPH2:quinone reductase
MRAVQVVNLSEDMSGTRLREAERPVAGPDEVLIRVHAASVNYPDLLMTRGAYQMKPDLPFTLGGDLAGTVEAVGNEVTSFEAGDPVCAVGLGAFADFATYAESMVTRKPEGLEFPQAAAFGAAYLTAYVALVERGRLARGEWVVIHGAAGGMGLAAVDLARALGARVIATSTSESKLAEVERLYHPEATVLARAGFREQVKEITCGGADLIFDPVGGDVFDESLRCIAFDGRLLVIGFTSGRIPTLATNLALIKGASIVGVRAGEYGRRFPDRRRRIVAELRRLAETKAIRPHVHATLPLERWREAFTMMEKREAIGKIVLVT